MIAERIREFETRREQLKGLASSFYNTALALLQDEGQSIELKNHYSYLFPAKGAPMGGGLELHEGDSVRHYTIVTGRILEAKPANFLLASTSNKNSLRHPPRDFRGDPFRDLIHQHKSGEFLLYMQSELIDITILNDRNSAACIFEFGSANSEVGDQQLTVFGRPFLVKGDYDPFVSQEMLFDFGAIVRSLVVADLDRLLSLKPSSVKSI